MNKNNLRILCAIYTRREPYFSQVLPKAFHVGFSLQINVDGTWVYSSLDFDLPKDLCQKEIEGLLNEITGKMHPHLKYSWTDRRPTYKYKGFMKSFWARIEGLNND